MVFYIIAAAKKKSGKQDITQNIEYLPEKEIVAIVKKTKSFNYPQHQNPAEIQEL